MCDILLFGASGFLGSKIQKHFENVQTANIREKDWQNEIPQNSKIWINCIGKAHDHKGEATEKDFYFANYELVKELFTAFLNSDSELFIHFSSIAAVEEFESNEPLTETATSNSTSFYGKSKRKAEEWLLAQQLPEIKKLIILRPPMIHGEGDKGSLRLLYNLISKGIPYPLSAFENWRSFISVQNVMFFLEKIIENQDDIESGIYQIADDEPVSTNQIIDVINKVENKRVVKLGVPGTLIKGMAKIGDTLPLFPLNSKKLQKMTSNLLVSNQKIKDALKIKNLPLSAEQGLEKTILSFGKKS